MLNEKAQTLLELTIVIAVAVLVIGALTFATIGSLRNASFAKNQAQATKLAQEGLEKVRSIRDRNTPVQTIRIKSSSGNIGSMPFAELYNSFLSHDYCGTVGGDSPCYFNFSSGTLTERPTSNSYESLTGGFQRQIQIFDRLSCDTIVNICYKLQKELTVIVSWNDFAGNHQSKLTTILRNPNL